MLSLYFEDHQQKLLRSIDDLQKLAETTAGKEEPNPKYLAFLNRLIADLTASYNYNIDLFEEMQRDISERYRAGYRAGREQSAPKFSRFMSKDREYIRGESITRAAAKWRF